MSKDPLLQPFRLKHLELRNRIVSTSHEPAYTEDGLPKERYRLYHEEKAKGGIALTMFGGSSIVAPDSPPAFGNIELYDPEVVGWLRKLADAVHAHGAALMCQITHLGRRVTWGSGDWLPALWPSAVREPAHRSFPKAIEDWDIERIVRAYGEGAARCREGGLDGIEIEAYGHLFDAFWSPAWNFRDDAYGGSLENRLRFGMEVLAEIRRRVGDDWLVGARMVADETMANGIDQATGFEIVGRYVATGWLDFVSVIRGHIETDEGLTHVIPGMGTPAAPHLEFARALKAELGVPVMHAARINDVATARHAIASGALDLVGMTRAHIAEPHIARKIEAGQEDRIRPCVGAGYCIDRIYEGGEALCIHNPATGREGSLPHVVVRTEGPKRRVVVVGAGPAGLEAARVCADRGHRVVVFEAASQPGGQIRLGAALGRRRELLGIVDWRVSELERAGAELRFNVYAEADEVLAEEPDVVVIATGGLPNTGFLEAGADLVVTSWDILNGDVQPGQNVLLFDDHGAHPGMTTAEVIAGTGARLELVTPERTLAPDIGGVNYPAYLKAFQTHGVTITLGLRLRHVARQGNQLKATFRSDYTHSDVARVVDQVVVEHGTLPLDDLYLELKPRSRNGGEVDYPALLAGRPQTATRNPDGAFQLFRVGDAVASRNIHAAIYDSLRLCKDF